MSTPGQNRGGQWAILGGGMLGMTLALELARRGRRITLYEAADHLGGLADAWRLDDVVWDRHYHVILLSDTALGGLLRELGLHREMRWVSARTGFYSNGRLHSLSSSMDFLRFPPLGLADKVRLAATILYASHLKDGRRLEQTTVDEWLISWSGRRTFEKIWLPLLRAKLGESHRRVSAAFIWATIRRLYRSRRQGIKREMFGYLPGGYARILDRLEDRLRENGITIRLGYPAKRVSPDGREGVQIDFCDGSRQRFGAVVLTTTTSIAASLCSGLSADEIERLNGIDYQGIVCASLLLRKPLSHYYVTNITDEGLPFTGVIEMDALVDRAQFGGNSLVYLPKYIAPGDPYFELSDSCVKQEFVAGLSRMYPRFRPDDIISFRVSRVRQVFALPTLGYSDRLPPVRTSVPGLYILNSAHIVNGTLNVDETVRLAQQGADLIQPLQSESCALEPSVL